MATWQALLAASGLARSEAQWLASHVAGRPRSWLLAHADEEAEVAVAQAAVGRLHAGASSQGEMAASMAAPSAGRRQAVAQGSPGA